MFFDMSHLLRGSGAPRHIQTSSGRKVRPGRRTRTGEYRTDELGAVREVELRAEAPRRASKSGSLVHSLPRVGHAPDPRPHYILFRAESNMPRVISPKVSPTLAAVQCPSLPTCRAEGSGTPM